VAVEAVERMLEERIDPVAPTVVSLHVEEYGPETGSVTVDPVQEMLDDDPKTKNNANPANVCCVVLMM
jgi:hypothetical protein